ncbi:DUF4259 domain-containing protein [Niabella pedocola]|uniref:DUF4259 domain-containing protein n=1 Tax=Niabella pedocola TaxID=1752077 RepID=A0ABS8PXY6_9BACT|nr:DUF4259 domain-containing protein [Niabella pedocola]MCD2425926.1 DUF4259 domain-containing protein [Niabella pedocola]
MGTWGTGYFENDTALDFMGDIEEADDPKELFEETLAETMDMDFLDADQGAAVIVIGAYIDRQRNGTQYSAPEHPGSIDIDTFPDRHPDIDFSELRTTVIKALKKVLANDSELNELWAENEGAYPVWRRNIEMLIERLSEK